MTSLLRSPPSLLTLNQKLITQSPKHVRQRYLQQISISNAVAGRQSPPPEEQKPKQGEEPTASGSVGQDSKQFDKASGEEKKGSEKILDELPSNPDPKARV